MLTSHKYFAARKPHCTPSIFYEMMYHYKSDNNLMSSCSLLSLEQTHLLYSS